MRRALRPRALLSRASLAPAASQARAIIISSRYSSGQQRQRQWAISSRRAIFHISLFGRGFVLLQSHTARHTSGCEFCVPPAAPCSSSVAFAFAFALLGGDAAILVAVAVAVAVAVVVAIAVAVAVAATVAHCRCIKTMSRKRQAHENGHRRLPGREFRAKLHATRAQLQLTTTPKRQRGLKQLSSLFRARRLVLGGGRARVSLCASELLRVESYLFRRLGSFRSVSFRFVSFCSMQFSRPVSLPFPTGARAS